MLKDEERPIEFPELLILQIIEEFDELSEKDIREIIAAKRFDVIAGYCEWNLGAEEFIELFKKNDFQSTYDDAQRSVRRSELLEDLMLYDEPLG